MLFTHLAKDWCVGQRIATAIPSAAAIRLPDDEDGSIRIDLRLGGRSLATLVLDPKEWETVTVATVMHTAGQALMEACTDD